LYGAGLATLSRCRTGALDPFHDLRKREKIPKRTKVILGWDYTLIVAGLAGAWLYKETV
jgi:hypothetical protein